MLSRSDITALSLRFPRPMNLAAAYGGFDPFQTAILTSQAYRHLIRSREDLSAISTRCCECSSGGLAQWWSS